ncbi:MAG: hypothetical protein ACKO6N_09775 [Myxococcota bacterium]
MTKQKSLSWLSGTSLAFVTVLSLSAVGCTTGTTGDDDTDSPTPSDSPNPNVTPTATPSTGGTTINDLNQGLVADKTVVTVRGIVTAINYKGSFWISTAEGGPYSGIYIFDEYAKKGTTAGIKPGAEVEVTGVYTIYYGVREVVIYADDGAVSLLDADKGLPPAVSLKDLSDLKVSDVCNASLDADFEPYMGVYLALPEVTVTTGEGACGDDPQYGLYELSDSDGNKILADDDNNPGYTPQLDDVIKPTGVLFYTSFNNQGKYKILPTEVDIISGQEPTPTPTPLPDDLTIQDVNQKPLADYTVVTLTGVLTVMDSAGNFWFQDEAGGEWAGLYVYDPNKKAQTAGAKPGDLVSVTGVFLTYKGLRELSIYKEVEKGNVTIDQAKVGVPSPVQISDLDIFSHPDACATGSDAELEPYVSLLVKLPNMEVELASGACTRTELWTIADASGDAIVVDEYNLNVDYVPVAGDVLDVTGVVKYNFDTYRLAPNGNAGVVKQ